jgi:hypothetical protein
MRTDDAIDAADCFTICEFCSRHRISERLYYLLREQGRGPAELRLGTKVLISKEAAARWRRAIEAEAVGSSG